MQDLPIVSGVCDNITLQDVSFPFSCGVVIVLVRIVCYNLFLRMLAVICIKPETFGILNLFAWW
jgi:hypothetical protein